jgi:hypothetical protein
MNGVSLPCGSGRHYRHPARCGEEFARPQLGARVAVDRSVILRTVWLSVAAAFVLTVRAASADCCAGPPISVSLPYDAPLTAHLRAAVSNDDPDHHADGDIRGLLNIRGHRVADLGIAHVADVSPTPQAVTFSLSVSQLAAIRTAAKRARATRAVIHFVVSNATDRLTVTRARVYAEDSFVSLTAGVHTARPTKLSVGRVGVSGSGQRLRGWVAFTAPRRWRGDSVDGASPAAFGPIALVAGCRASLFVPAVAVATSHPDAYVAAVGGPGQTLAAGRHGTSEWRVRAGATRDALPAATAVGIAPIARRRYAGLRVDVRFDPGCPASAARSGGLIRGLTQVVRDMSVHARLAR